MQSLLAVFGHRVEARAVAWGTAISSAVTLGAGVGAGSLVDERTVPAFVINGVLLLGLIAGGAVAAAMSSASRLVAAVLTAAVPMAVAVAVQVIRRFVSGAPTAGLGLPLSMLLAASAATLGGVIGSRWAARKRSLIVSGAPRRLRARRGH